MGGKMKILFFIILTFILINNVYCEEGKQENIIRIDKFGESSKIIQNPMQSEKPLLKGSEIEKQEKVVIEKPKTEPIIKRMERKVAESLVLKNAWKLYEDGKFEQAKEKFSALLDSIHREIALSSRLGLAYSLKNLNFFERSLENFEYLYKKNYKQEEVLRNIVEILIRKENYPEAEKYAIKLSDEEGKRYLKNIQKEKIKRSFKEISGSQEKSIFLDFLKENAKYLNDCLSPEIFFEIAKRLKSFGEKEKSKDAFERLLSCKIESDLKLGIFYELSSLISIDEMLIIIEKEEREELEQNYFKQLTSLKLDLYRKKLSSLDISSSEIEKIAEKILRLAPDDVSTKALLAWHYYNVREYDKALNIFFELNKKEPEKEDYILGIAYCYNALEKDEELIALVEGINISSEKLNLLKANAYIRKANRSLQDGNYSKAFSEIKKLTQQRDNISKEKASEWYCKQGFPLLASNVDSSNDRACYFREQFPQFEIETAYRYKSGDEGFSELKELRIPISFHYPIREGQKLSLSIIQRYVSSGSTGKTPYLGTYYNYLNGETEKNSPITSKWLFQPQIVYEIEDYPHIKLSISSTPLNGTVSPLPLFSANVDYRNFWFNLHQTLLEESILSLQGQRDPYSSAKWGRVLKTGVQAGINLDLSHSYWFSISGEFDYIWGKNIWENYSAEGNLSFGKTFLLDHRREFDLGIFYVFKHFRRNSNFFTFGHGGYFSPQSFHMIGPTLRYKIKECCGISLDIKTSIGYMHYKTDSAPRYPKFSANETLFNASALDDIRGNYEGESKSKLGGSIEARFKYNITKKINLFGYGKGNVSGEYNEWNIGLGLIYYFMP